MKLLITGASGFLGSRIYNYYKDHHEVVALSHQDLDITSSESVNAALCTYRPDAVIHCAAISNTGYAQEHPDLSRAINVEGTIFLSQACFKYGAKFLYMSSDQVYNGTAKLGLLPETAPLTPVNVYGSDKFLAEQEVSRILPSAVGLRLTWMYDFPRTDLKVNSNIIVNLLKAYKEHQTLKIATHEYRGMTNVWDVVRNIEKALSLPGGVYNFGSENTFCSYDTFLEAAHALSLGQPETWILPDKERFSTQARNLSISIERIRQFGIDFSSTIEEIRRDSKTFVSAN